MIDFLILSYLTLTIFYRFIGLAQFLEELQAPLSMTRFYLHVHCLPRVGEDFAEHVIRRKSTRSRRKSCLREPTGKTQIACNDRYGNTKRTSEP